MHPCKRQHAISSTLQSLPHYHSSVHSMIRGYHPARELFPPLWIPLLATGLWRGFRLNFLTLAYQTKLSRVEGKILDKVYAVIANMIPKSEINIHLKTLQSCHVWRFLGKQISARKAWRCFMWNGRWKCHMGGGRKEGMQLGACRVWRCQANEQIFCFSSLSNCDHKEFNGRNDGHVRVG